MLQTAHLFRLSTETLYPSTMFYYICLFNLMTDWFKAKKISNNAYALAITSRLISVKNKMKMCNYEFHAIRNKGNNKITELRTILQRESQNS